MEQFSVCSTSSSENEFVSESPIESYHRFPNIPAYPYVGRRPFVYNACVQPQDKPKHRNRISKKNNCFAKAFRWYTQELPRNQRESTVDQVKIAGFAAWLDKKYEQFLCDNKCENNCLKSKQQYCIPNTDVTERMEPTTRKTKFQRLKSPWKKNRQFANDTERCSLRETCSFKFLLRPEEVRRASSECCQKSSCCKCSYTTFTNSKTAIPSKTKGKSQSAICIRFEQPMNITNYETCRSFNKDITADAVEYSGKNNQKIDFETMKTVSMKDVSCACGPENIIPVNRDKKLGTSQNTCNQIPVIMSAELSKKDRKPTNYCEANVMTEPTSSYERPIFSNETSHHSKTTVCCQCSIQYILKNDCCYCTTESKFRFEKVGCLQNSSIPCCPCPLQPTPQCLVTFNETGACNSSKGLHQMFNETVVQTSDHSIIFDRNPLFVKMICGNEYV